jgi:CRISPR-associated protein Csm5
MKTYKLKCEVLSPVHIGSGREIDPLDYVVEAGVLYKVSFEKFVSSMDEPRRQQFESLIENGNLVSIRRYVSDNFKKGTDVVYSVLVSPQVDNLYKQKLSDIQNQLIVNPFIRTQGGALPFFPGSTIKGAIRTAVVSEYAGQSSLPKPTTMKEEYEFEGRVLGYRDGKDDPFRAVKIRDALLKNDDFIVREVNNVTRNRNGGLQSNEIQMICEVSHSQISGKGVVFETELSVDDDLISTKFLNKALTFEKITDSCKRFYRDKLEKEHSKFYKNSEVKFFSEQLLNTPLDGGSFLLRMGRFSGVESVTIDNYRNPRPPGRKGWGSSRNLVEGIFPMGWVKITIV